MILRKISTIIILAGMLTNSIFAGSLSGRVNFKGNAPKKKTLKMDADPVCGAAHKTPPYRQSFIINDIAENNYNYNYSRNLCQFYVCRFPFGKSKL